MIVTDKSLNISLNDFVQLVDPQCQFNNELFIIVLETSGSKFEWYDNVPVQFNALSLILVQEGELTIHIDYYPYKLTRHAVMGKMKNHIINSVALSKGFKGYNIVITQDFLNRIFEKEDRIPLDIITAKPFDPIQQLSPEHFDLVLDIVGKLMKDMCRNDHIFQASLIRNETGNFLMELLNIHQHKNASFASTQLGHREKTILKFIALLIDHCKSQHEVSFYAEELCMTPKSLSRILKPLNGKTAARWIADAIVSEAKLLLRKPGVSIQFVSEELCFSDQSSFGKFFKKHTGLSPTDYKNNFLRE